MALSTFQPFTALAQEHSSDEPNRAVARVNGVAITVKMLNQAMEQRIPATGHRMLSEKRLSEIGAEELDKLIIQELLLQEAERLGIKADSKEVEAELSKVKDRFPSEKKFREALDRQGLTLSDLREGLEHYLIIQKLTEQEIYSKISLTEAELQEYYKGHKEQFEIPEQIRLRVLLVRVDPSGFPEDWEKGHTKAKELADRVRAGEDFASLATQFSNDEMTRGKGGDTGLLHRGRLSYSELEPVAFSYDVGQVSEPIKTLYGYVVFKVQEKYPARQLSYEEVNKELLRNEMSSSAARKRWEDLITVLKAKAEITIY